MARDSDRLKVIRDRWDFANEADRKQREREREDLSFYEGEGQWDSDIRTLRKGMAASGNNPAVPARPCLTINKIRDPIRKIQNDELQADLGMSITAADDFVGQIDSNEIELREGLGRRIQRDSYAKDARMWGANRAAICGRGWWGITTEYVDGDSLDQEIRYELFYDQFSVLPDPTHEQPDGSDAEFYFVGRDFPLDIYRDKFPSLANGRDNPLASSTLTDSEWRAFCDDAPSWVREEGERRTRTIRVTRYWHYERDSYQIVMLDDSSVVRADAVNPDFLETIPAERKRERVVRKVKCTLTDGVNIIEEIDWPGKYIPIIKVVGERIHTFNGERYDEGMVRPARDPQKAYNAMISSAVETVAMAPKSPWLVPFRAIENFQDQWKEGATRNWPALYYNDVDPDTGLPIAPPQRNQAEPPIQAMAAMLGAFDQGIMATIGQANLADTHPDVRSGEMASRLLDEAARGTSNYLANLIRSVHYEGMIVNDLLYPIYGMRPGRIVSMITGSGKPQRVMIGTQQQPMPFVTPQPGAMPQPAMMGQEAQTYTLTKDGSFNVAIEATKFYETRKQEKVALMASMLEKSPEQVSIIGDLFFEAIGEEDMAKRYQAVLDPRVVEMLKSGQPPDPRIQQLMQMGQQVSQELMQLKADKGARVEQAQIKAMADAATTDKENQTKLEIARIQQETAVMVADLKATVQQQADAANAIQEQMRTLVELMEEDRLTRKQHEHELTTLHHAQAHELGMAMVEHQHAKDALSHEADVMPPQTPSQNGSGE